MNATTSIEILAREVMERCDALGLCSEDPECLARTFLSPPMHAVHQLVRGWMEEASLDVHVDAVGNIVGQRPGEGTFLIGSHLDTVVNAGLYDGPLGVMIGIAAAKLLATEELPFGLAIAGFSEEEGVRFGVPYLGSMAIAGNFNPALLGIQNASEETIRDAIVAFGLDPAEIPQAEIRNLIGYAEVHIEQGPVLEALREPLAAVTSIIGQERLLVAYEGHAGHAGTTPMNRRQDASIAAARLILATQEYALSVEDLRATIGAVRLNPNVRNVIAGRAELSLDIRHADDPVRRRAASAILAKAREIAAKERIAFKVISHESQLSVPADEGLTMLMERALDDLGYSTMQLVSGAGHDAVAMARVCPWTMLFVRSPGGISHHPSESVSQSDVAHAIAVLAQFLRRLAATHSSPGAQA